MLDVHRGRIEWEGMYILARGHRFDSIGNQGDFSYNISRWHQITGQTGFKYQTNLIHLVATLVVTKDPYSTSKHIKEPGNPCDMV